MKSYLLRTITASALIYYADIAPAAVYTCIDNTGKKIFQGTPCKNSKSIDKKLSPTEKEEITIERERREKEIKKQQEKENSDKFWEFHNLKKKKVRSLWKPVTKEDRLLSELVAKAADKLKRNLKEPESFVLEQFYTPYKIHAERILMYQFDITYRAKNGFGGYGRETKRVSILVSSDAYNITFHDPNGPAPEPFVSLFPDSIINAPDDQEQRIPSNDPKRFEL